jgi:hypothetical protein|tara:strand:+ start:186 stop:788 length:603 start_codon:yes stop_codon:yes gene_type:complete
MLKSEIIIEQMCLQEMTHNALKDKLRKYRFGTVEVQNFINLGVETAYENHVKFALNMKTPVGWIPTPIREDVDTITKTAPKDVVKKHYKQGKDHHNYVNGNGVRQRETWQEAIKKEIENGTIIKQVVKDLGGFEKVSQIIGCCSQTIRTLHHKRHRGVYLPSKYLDKIKNYSMQNEIVLPIEQLMDMIPQHNRTKSEQRL